MKPGSILLNTSRGSVVVGADLKTAFSTGHLGAAVLDVWENEPSIDVELLQRVALGTPHIAGYSFDGKVAGTRMLYDALCGHFQIADKTVDWPGLVPGAEEPEISLCAYLR